MGVHVEQEYRIKRAKSTGRDPKIPKLSGRHLHASKSAFNHKVRHGADKKAYNWTPTKEVTFKITGSGKTPAGIKMALTTLPVMVNLRLTTMMAMAVKKLDVGEILTLVLHQV